MRRSLMLDASVLFHVQVVSSHGLHIDASLCASFFLKGAFNRIITYELTSNSIFEELHMNVSDMCLNSGLAASSLVHFLIHQLQNLVTQQYRSASTKAKCLYPNIIPPSTKWRF
ncbi:hypothetical protein GGI42DRAFT_135525 [Trichoderma sp. SZMC 28013]